MNPGKVTIYVWLDRYGAAPVVRKGDRTANQIKENKNKMNKIKQQ